MPARPPKPWQQQENEGGKAYEAFAMYRDMGPQRSCAKVAVRLGKSVQLLEQWSSKHNWVARVRAHTEMQERIDRLARRKAQQEMAHRHAQIATGFQDKVLKRLRALDAQEMTVSECLRMFVSSTKIEAEARRIPVRDILPQPKELQEALDDYAEDDADAGRAPTEESQAMQAAADAMDAVSEEGEEGDGAEYEVEAAEPEPPKRARRRPGANKKTKQAPAASQDAEGESDDEGALGVDNDDGAPADPLAHAFQSAAARREAASAVEDRGPDEGAPKSRKGGMRVVKGGKTAPGGDA